MLFWSLWVRTFITTFSIPHLALSADLTEGYQHRSEVLGSRMAFIFLTAVLLPTTATIVEDVMGWPGKKIGQLRDRRRRLVDIGYRMLGSVAEGLVRKAEVPALVVPAPHRK